MVSLVIVLFPIVVWFTYFLQFVFWSHTATHSFDVYKWSNYEIPPAKDTNNSKDPKVFIQKEINVLIKLHKT